MLTNQNEDFVVKEKNAVYLSKLDGSRIYIDGPWMDKQLWVGEGGFLYEKIPGNARRYVNGPYMNRNSFLDSTGRWYYINENGRIVYYPQ